MKIVSLNPVSQQSDTVKTDMYNNIIGKDIQQLTESDRDEQMEIVDDLLGDIAELVGEK